MRKIIYIELLLFIATTFVACNKEEEILPETKTVTNSNFHSLQQKHDFAITVISGDSINKTIYGRFDSNIKGCRKISNGITYEYTYEYIDSNTCTISKIGNNTVAVVIEDFTGNNPILLSNISQENNCVSFNMVENDTILASCSMIIPDSIDFINALPISYSTDDAEAKAYSVGPLIPIFAKLAAEIITSLCADDADATRRCYAHMERLAQSCTSGKFVVHHSGKHRRCSFECY